MQSYSEVQTLINPKNTKLGMLVLDSSALMQPIDFSDACTVPEVLEEVRNRPSRLRIESAISAGKLTIREPSPESIAIASEACQKSGDLLSRTDIRLVALAMETSATLVTDDYGMQNVAKLLNISFQPLSQKGIKKTILWKNFCPNCKKIVSGTECPSCGSKTKRMASKPTGLRK